MLGFGLREQIFDGHQNMAKRWWETFLPPPPQKKTPIWYGYTDGDWRLISRAAICLPYPPPPKKKITFLRYILLHLKPCLLSQLRSANQIALTWFFALCVFCLSVFSWWSLVLCLFVPCLHAFSDCQCCLFMKVSSFSIATNCIKTSWNHEFLHDITWDN